MTKHQQYTLLTYLIATAWFANGLLCKVLHLVPRHEQIVARILGDTYATELTVLIGLSEVVMAVWVLSRYLPKLNALVQMMVVATMNILEFLLVPDLLLWGRLNAVFALFFIGWVYYRTFVLEPQLSPA